MLLISFLLLTLGLFGLRGVISNLFFVELIGSQYVFLFLRVFYWLCIFTGAISLLLWLRNERVRLLVALEQLRQNWCYLLSIILSALPFLYLVVTKRLGLDFWLDEVISIRRHIVTNLTSALFWYPVPNNHVFTNAISGMYLKVIDAKDLLSVLQDPAMLRSFYLAFGIGTFIICTWTAYRFAGRIAAIVMVVLFTTTLAYLNFVVQVRGYSPSIFFAACLLHAALSYRRDGQRSWALALLVFSALLLYSIPSNLYFLLALFSIFLLPGIYQSLRREKQANVSLSANDFRIFNRPLTLSLGLALGCGLAVLFYLPILDKVLENRYVATLGAFRGSAFPGLLLESLKVFISGRTWLFASAAIGLLVLLIDKKSPGRAERLMIVCFLSAIIILPFLLSALRGDEPFVRSFFVLLPAFFLLAGFGIQTLSERLPDACCQGKAGMIIAMLAIIGYANFVFLSAYIQASADVAATLAKEDVVQVEFLDNRMSASVFLDHYDLRQVIEQFLLQADNTFPVLIDRANTRYVFTLSVYFEAYGIDYEEFEDPADLTHSEAYIFLSYPGKANSEWLRFFPNLACENISASLTIYQVMHCRFD
jgi:hypothetical protein